MKTTMLSSLARVAKRQAGRVWALGLAVGLVASMAAAGPADAHGEKSQAAFLRMRTLNWYDLKWSKTTVNVNEEYEISGKLHIMNAWPAAVHVPDNAFLNVGQPGPVAVREAVFVGGQFTPRSQTLKLGETYEFRVLLKARRPGHWHTHVQLSVETGGPIPGPGQYIDIKGNMADFRDDIKLLNGTTVDLEDFQTTKIYLWHLLWAVAGAAWIWYWFSKRGFIGRFVAVASGKGEELITPQERTVGAIVLGAVLGTVIIFYAIVASQYPNTIPLQAGLIRNIEPIPGAVGGPVAIKYLGGSYKVPGRELVANFKITNEGKEPLRIGEFATAGLRFLNPDVFTSKVDYPDYLLADRGLSLSDNSPIQPGETRDITLTIQDARWDTERLSGLAYDVDSSFAGLLFLFSPTGTRYAIEVGGAVIPTFMPV
ncbi:methane monooxygenase/ammonia monooxygenase subunit B [Beijerinckiaceae bacterium]|nr:methane monooxygenase/ammonia monooxygenase subunit B [Beijerinckiaceae bacterium]